MASEDSRKRDGLRWFMCLHNPCDIDQAGHREMAPLDHPSDDLGKPGELIAFRRSQ